VITPRPRLLMCPPDAYDLRYEINAWMSLRNRPDVSRAREQWRALHRVLTEQAGAEVELITQAPNAPDMVFTANAGLVAGARVFLSRFRHPERQVEEEPFRRWFQAHGFEVREPPPGIHFEGEGDALFAGDTLVAGYLKRSDIAAHRWLAAELGIPVLSLELVDPRWYHLDTAFFALTPDLIVHYPGAFDEYARRALRHRFETIEVAEEEAMRFACNSVVLGRHVVIPEGCPRLGAELERRGWRVHPVPMTEFLKSGGACKCLALHLGQVLPAA